MPTQVNEHGVVEPASKTTFSRLLERLSNPDSVAEDGASAAAAGTGQAGQAPDASAVGVQDVPARISRRNHPLIVALQAGHVDASESERGVVVTLRDVVFEFGSDEMTFGARRKMRRISEIIDREAKGRGISVEGHTDAIGPSDYNQALSERRAAAVASQLLLNGVPEALTSSSGYGELRPTAPNTFDDGSDNPAGRARNRRVEIVIQN